MKKLKHCFLAILILAFAFSFSGCQNQGQPAGQDENMAVKDVSAMDTTMTLNAYGDKAQAAVDAAEAEILRLDAMLSTGNPDSEIAKLNKEGHAVLSEDASYLVKRALELNKSTGGAFNIAVYPLMEEWGFTTKDYKVPSDDRIKELLQNVDVSGIEFNEETGEISLPENVEIDLGGIAKGYTSSRIMEIFKENGVSTGLVSLGGNVQTLGHKTDGSEWKIGIEAPEDNASDYVGVLQTADRAVITSGGYERFFEQKGVRYHHILDPETGKPADAGLISVTIISDDGTLADGLSTSLFIMGEKKAVAYWQKHSDEFDIVLVRDDGSVIISEGITDSFTTERNCETVTK